MTKDRVAVLGAGIMGGATALHLARLGVPVTLFDAADAPFSGASRWNEGKIHLGFLYAADASLETARAVLPGGLDFRDQVESLTALPLGPITTPADDVYVIHRDSVVHADAAAHYFGAVGELVRSHPRAHRYLADASRGTVERVSQTELAALAAPSTVVAAFRVPERSVDTNVVADAFVDALEGESLVELCLGRHVTDVTRSDRWFVETALGRDGPFDGVVNALWQGRPGLDRSVGLIPDAAPHHRYRVSCFVRTATAVEAPNAVIAAGAFGDVKSYSERSFYLSWYSTGLLARADGIDPPSIPALGDVEKQRIAADVFDALADTFPWVRNIEAAACEVRVEGGWVYSQGGGSLADPAAAIHRRDRLGITQSGSYFSVDTGKYSVAPTLAERLARNRRSMSMVGMLRENEREAFHRDGYLRGGRIGSPEEMQQIADRVDAALTRPKHPDVHRHLDNRTVYDLCAHPEIVERVASILGPDIVVWHSRVFHKRDADPEIPWHQDGLYWTIDPLISVSAWIAIERADRVNACVEVIPGSHRTRVPHTNASTTGRFSRHADRDYVDASNAVAMELDPGEFFLFDTWLLHSSAVNTSGRRRTALSVRYTTPDVKVAGDTLSPSVPGYGVQLVRGRDTQRRNSVARAPD